MITANDREQALAGAPLFVQLARQNPSALKVFLRALEDLGSLTSSDDTSPDRLMPIIDNGDDLSRITDATLQKVWGTFVAEVGETSVRQYSTREMARYFGVSITTVNHWIAEHRFIGIRKAGPHKHARIPDSALWLTSRGERIPVRDIIRAYENHAPRPYPSEQARQQHEDDLQRFESKYGGSFNSTFGVRPPRSLEEERDAWEWQYALNALRARTIESDEL